MVQVIFKASEEEKQLWVETAHDERMTLSAWIRSRLNEGAVPDPVRLVDGAGKQIATVSGALTERGSTTQADEPGAA